MEHSLNDNIEKLFKGLVFVILSYARSVYRLVRHWREEPEGLLERVASPDEFQIRPYVFSFVTFFLVAAVPPIRAALPAFFVPHPPLAAVAMPDPNAPEPVVRLGYEATVASFDAASLTSILFAAVVGVTLFHLVLTAAGTRSFGTRMSEMRDRLLYVGGGLVLLLLVLGLVLDWAYGETELLAPFIAGNLSSLGWLSIAVLCAIACALPLPMIRRAGYGLGILLLLDLTSFGAFAASAYLSQETRPLDKPPFIADVDCRVENGTTANVMMVVANPSKEALNIVPSDFTVTVGSVELQVRSHGTPVLVESGHSQLIVLSASSARNSLVAGGRCKVFSRSDYRLHREG